MADLAEHYRIIKRPLFTEKGSFHQRFNIYAFAVDPAANKVQIRKAVEAIWDVKVISVRTQNVPGKRKRVGWVMGHTALWKKALIKLKEGDTIQLF